MGTYEELKAAIQQVIRTNGNNEITGALLQNALLSIVNVVGANATFAGIATPNTNPGTADQNVFYLATEAGTYVNFGGIEINMGEAVILSNKTGNWVKTTSGFATQQQLTDLEFDVIKRTNKAEYDVNDFENELMINANGQIESNAYFRVLRKLFVLEGDVIETIGVVSDNAVACCIAAYDANGNFLSDKSVFKDMSNSKKYVVSEGVAYLAIGTLLRIEDVKVSIPTAITFDTLKKDIAKLESEIGLIYDSEYTIDDFEDNLMVDLQGNIVSNNYIRVLKNVPVSEGDVVETIGVLIDNAVACCIAAYDANGNFLSDKSIFKDTSERKQYVVPEGVAYLSFSTLLRIENVNVAVNKSTFFTTLRDEIKTLSSGLNGLKVLNYEDFTEKETFIESNGKEVFNSEYITTDFILIQGIKKLSVVGVMGNKYGGGIVFYDKWRNFISQLYDKTTNVREISEYNVNLEEIPNNAWYIKVQGRKGYENQSVTYHVAPNKDTNAILQYNKPLFWERKKAIYYDSAESLAANDYLIIEDSPNIRNGYIIQASAKVNSMGRVRISKGTGAYAAGIVDIDVNNVYEYNPNNPTAFNTYEHGLAITDFIRITILVSDAPMTATITGNAKLILESVGGRYEKDIMWNGGNNNVVFLNTSANLTDAEITLSIKGKDVWYFGDSYLDFWTPYAYKLGGSNILIDGYSGRASEAAYISLLREKLVNLPKKIVWGMGMNDGDKTDSVNSTWKYYYEQVMAFCNRYGIELILVTIPNTPTVTNFYKNQIIRESGYRYLDVAKLMGAEDKSSSWYSGLMSGDNVHPTDLGAKILATYIVSQLAEIVI